MLEKHIVNKILENFQLEPTPSQSLLIDSLGSYVTDVSEENIFLIKGYAGTGKTSLISAFVQTLDQFKIKSVLMAPTGRAAKVLGKYADRQAYTVHKKIYRQKSSNDGFGNFSVDKNLHTDTFFIIDEASMLSNQLAEASVFGTGRLLDDLVEYVYSSRNCRLILIGDTAQLPPVGLDVSPALNKDELESLYNKNVIEHLLTDVVRQGKDSGILTNATSIRNKIAENDSGYLKFDLEDFSDIQKLGGADLIEELNSAHSLYGMDETMVVCRSNKRSNKFNQGIRNMILYREEELSVGDYLMIVKNNYFWTSDVKEMDFIANGDIAEIIRINSYVEMYGFRFADVSLSFADYKYVELDCMIILDTLDIDTPALTYDQNKELFFKISEDYSDIRSKKQRYEKIREDKFFNALQVKYAYAVTCHKAQGGQWKAVFVDQGYVTEEMLNKEYYRWLYTALTRATDKLYLVNFNKEFFDGEE